MRALPLPGRKLAIEWIRRELYGSRSERGRKLLDQVELKGVRRSSPGRPREHTILEGDAPRLRRRGLTIGPELAVADGALGFWMALEPNRADRANFESRFLFRLVLSCVDDNGARDAIQNLWLEMIIGGSTHGLTAKAINYDMVGDQVCLKCYNSLPSAMYS